MLHVISKSRSHVLQCLKLPNSNALTVCKESQQTITTGQTIAIPPPHQPAVISEDGSRTLRARQHGNNSLPLPPLLDPLAIEAKRRHKQPKQPVTPDDERTTCQKLLEDNPDARALATPVRTCAFTGARLPSHFLLPLLARLTTSSSSSHAGKEGEAQPSARVELVPECLLPDSASTQTSPSRAYILNRKHVLEELNTKKKWAQIPHERMRKWYALKMGKQLDNVNMRKEWAWDEDTADKVLASLRKHVCDGIVAGMQKDEPGVRPLAAAARPLEDNSAQADFACVIQLAHVDRVAQSMSKAGEVRNDLAGFVKTKNKSLVFDLSELLSADLIPSVLPSLSTHSSPCLVVIKGGKALELQLALMKLQAFLAPAEQLVQGKNAIETQE